MRKTNRSLSSSLEPLEPRIAPASVVAPNPVGGALKISALAGIGANFNLHQTGPDSFILMDGPTNTVFTGIKSVLINLSDFNDNVSFSAIGGAPGFKGPVTINTENGVPGGQDSINIQSSAVFKGTVTIKSDGASITNVFNGARFFGALKVTSPGGGLIMGGLAETVTTSELNYVSLENGADIKRALTVNALEALTSLPSQFLLKSGAAVRGVLSYVGGDSNDAISLEGAVLGKTAIKLGNGSNSVISQFSYRTASLAVTGGAGPDTVQLNGDSNFTSIGGVTTLALGDGQNLVSTSNLRAGGAFKITTGSGNDILSIGSGLLGGVLQVSLGNGNNTMNIGSPTIGGGLKVTAGLGNDLLNIGAASILGPTRLAMGAGGNVFGQSAGGTQYEGGFAYVGLGDTDLVILGGAVVKGSAFISTGDGNNTVNLFSTQVHGATQIKGGQVGNDNFLIDGNSNLSGALTINAGNGSNGTTISGLSNVTTFLYNGGSGADGVSLGGGTSIPGAGLFTRGTVKLGAGADSVNFLLPGFLTFKIDGGADVDQITGGHPDLLLLNFETGV